MSPSRWLPRGALLVEEIDGRNARLPRELEAIVRALASLHMLPPPAQRRSLIDAAHPLVALLAEVQSHASFLTAATPEISSCAATTRCCWTWRNVATATPAWTWRATLYTSTTCNMDGCAVLTQRSGARLVAHDGYRVDDYLLSTPSSGSWPSSINWKRVLCPD